MIIIQHPLVFYSIAKDKAEVDEKESDKDASGSDTSEYSGGLSFSDRTENRLKRKIEEAKIAIKRRSEIQSQPDLEASNSQSGSLQTQNENSPSNTQSNSMVHIASNAQNTSNYKRKYSTDELPDLTDHDSENGLMDKRPKLCLDQDNKDSASVEVFSDDTSVFSDYSKISSVKETTNVLAGQQYYQQQLTHYRNNPMVGRDTVCVFCLTCCSINEKQPQILTCLHSACLECFKERVDTLKKEHTESRNIAKADTVTGEHGDEDCCEIVDECDETEVTVVPCPLCKVSTPEDQIHDNLFLQFAESQIEGDGKSTYFCDSCEERNVADSLCKDCKEHLCADCVKAHQRVKLTKEHTITVINRSSTCNGADESPSTRKALNRTCRDHDNESLSIFCRTCELLTCRKCQLSGTHKNHTYEFSADVLPDVRSSIEQGVADLKLKKNVLDESRSLLGAKMGEFDIKEKALLNQLEEVKNYIFTKLEARFKKLKFDASKTIRTKRKVVEERKEILNRYYLQADYAQVFSEYMLQQSSQSDDGSFALLSSKQVFDKQIRRIKTLDPSSGLADETSAWKLDLYFQQYCGQQLHSSLESVLKQVMEDVKVLDAPPPYKGSRKTGAAVELDADSSSNSIEFSNDTIPRHTRVISSPSPQCSNSPRQQVRGSTRGGSPARGMRIPGPMIRYSFLIMILSVSILLMYDSY